jgi:hypothetical protein
MKYILFITALMSGPVAAQELEFAGRVGQLKGYEAINEHVMERLLDQDQPSNRFFELSRFFGEPFPIAGGLSTLLGSYSGQGTSNDFRNGTPNGVNMLLWHLGFVALGQSLGQVCDDMDATINPPIASTPPFVVNAMTLTALQAVCTAGADPAAQTAALEQVWMAVFAYDLPERELRAFTEFYAADAAYLAARGQDQIAMAVNGMLLNPLFLLTR